MNGNDIEVRYIIRPAQQDDDGLAHRIIAQPNLELMFGSFNSLGVIHGSRRT
jgi:hypothetical protein